MFHNITILPPLSFSSHLFLLLNFWLVCYIDDLFSQIMLLLSSRGNFVIELYDLILFSCYYVICSENCLYLSVEQLGRNLSA